MLNPFIRSVLVFPFSRCARRGPQESHHWPSFQNCVSDALLWLKQQEGGGWVDNNDNNDDNNCKLHSYMIYHNGGGHGYNEMYDDFLAL